MLKMSLPYLPSADLDDRNEIIRRYFTLGFKYDEILAFLSSFHKYTLSLAQLKRILKRLNWLGTYDLDIILTSNCTSNQLYG